MELNIAQVSNKGKKIAIVAGKAIIKRFLTLAEAQKQLKENREIYEFWAKSCSVSTQNTTPIVILCQG